MATTTTAAVLAVGTFVVNLNHTPAVVVGKHHGDPVLQGINSYGRKSGGKWVADAAKCTVCPTALAAHELAGLWLVLQAERDRAVVNARRLDAFLASEGGR